MTNKLPQGTNVKDALALRNIFRKRKPTFTPQDMHKKKRVKAAWRKPVGLHSKMRQRLKHHKRVVKSGYKGPALVHGYDKRGFLPKIVSTLQDVAALQKHEGAIIARTTGLKVKLILIQACEKRGISVLNIRVQAFKDAVKQKEDLKKQAKAARASKKEETKKEASAQAKKKEQEQAKAQQTEQAQTPEEKKDQEKKEKDDALIHTT